MIHVVLYEPEIPENTGNIARTCALTGAQLHMIRPFGFSTDERSLKRAGLDYWDKLTIEEHDCFEDYLKAYPDQKIYLMTTKGTKEFWDEQYPENVSIVFGSESCGLPDRVHQKFQTSRLTIPMRKEEGLRSLNLSNSVAIGVYAILYQFKIKGI